jgi:hypothetical protein
MTKSGIISALAAKHGYVSYLEISTPLTGFEFDRVSFPGLGTRHRFAYWCRHDSDKQPALIRRDDLLLDAGSLREHAKYDIILVDSHHTYECSMRDLLLARALLAEGGTLVVHDSNPPDEDIVTPPYRPGPWCGTTYAAVVDFVLNSSDLEHRTIDIDTGCTIIRRRRQDPGKSDADLAQIWERSRGDDELRFKAFASLRHRLLNLVSLDEFLRDEGLKGLSHAQ